MTAAVVARSATASDAPLERDAYVVDLVTRAGSGDDLACRDLVDEYIGLMWSIARSYRLREADAADVVQTAWLRLVENIDRIKDPARVGAWLTTTVRRECLRALAYSARVSVMEESTLDRAAGDPDPLDEIVAQEQSRELRRAIKTLPEAWQRLMNLLLRDPQPSYAEVSAELDMPVGSIGPTRQRCIERLRAELQLQPV